MNYTKTFTVTDVEKETRTALDFLRDIHEVSNTFDIWDKLPNGDGVHLTEHPSKTSILVAVASYACLGLHNLQQSNIDWKSVIDKINDPKAKRWYHFW